MIARTLSIAAVAACFAGALAPAAAHAARPDTGGALVCNEAENSWRGGYEVTGGPVDPNPPAFLRGSQMLVGNGHGALAAERGRPSTRRRCACAVPRAATAAEPATAVVAGASRSADTGGPGRRLRAPSGLASNPAASAALTPHMTDDDHGRRSMRRLAILAGLTAALLAPAAARADKPAPGAHEHAAHAAHPATGAHQNAAHAGGTHQNAAQMCRAERGAASATEDAFRSKYGTNHNGANAFGKCARPGPRRCGRWTTSRSRPRSARRRPAHRARDHGGQPQRVRRQVRHRPPQPQRVRALRVGDGQVDRGRGLRVIAAAPAAHPGAGCGSSASGDPGGPLARRRERRSVRRALRAPHRRCTAIAARSWRDDLGRAGRAPEHHGKAFAALELRAARLRAAAVAVPDRPQRGIFVAAAPPPRRASSTGGARRWAPAVHEQGAPAPSSQRCATTSRAAERQRAALVLRELAASATPRSPRSLERTPQSGQAVRSSRRARPCTRPKEGREN